MLKSNFIHREAIPPSLPTTSFIGSKIIHLESVDSTNSYAKKLLSGNCEDGAIIIADEQTAGKGRLGRTWETEKGSNLTFSIILKPGIPMEQLGLLSLCAGTSVTAAIHKIPGITANCKWPNDVLINNKKVCGILSEIITHTAVSYSVIIGIGINVNQVNFPAELSKRATSLQLATGNEINMSELFASTIEQFELRYLQLLSGNVSGILTEWKQYTTMLGQPISVDRQGSIIHGIAIDINTDGSLLIKSNDENISVYSGDVTILK